MKSNTIKNIAVKCLLGISLLSTSLQAAEVELLNEFNITMSRYGQVWHSEFFTVAVDSFPAEKQVSIYREKSDGSWVDIPMYFFAPAGNGKEIWKLNNTDGNWGDEFVVKLTVNGAQYWDNNYGNNYQINSEGFIIGKAAEVSVQSWSTHEFSPDTSRLFATIVVDNLGPVKNVELIYSFDSWSTSTAVAAIYNGSHPVYGYGSYPNPSANNAEGWHVGFEFPTAAKGEFYIKYSVNGVDYFDNNFGANYKINPTTQFDSMYLKMGPHWSNGMPMRAVGENLWAANIQVNQPNGITAVKFDAFDDWQANFGDSNFDGIADENGADIAVPGTGSYRVLFNDQSLRYSFQKFGLE